MSRIDTDALKQRIEIEDLIRECGIELRKQGNELRALCPFHQENTPSFTVTPGEGNYYCFGCGAGGDHIKFLEELYQLDFREAAGKLQEIVGGSGIDDEPAPRQRKAAQKKSRPQDKWQHAAPGEDVPPPETLRIQRNGKWINTPVVASWPYRDRKGMLHGYACRVEPEPGKKDVIPVCWMINTETGEADLRQKSLTEPRLLYGTELLDQYPDANVILTEGEKDCDAGRRLLNGKPVIVLTWPGGCKAVNKADWSLLAGRKVVGWPDCDSQLDKRTDMMKAYQDQPGMKAMLDVADEIQKHGGQMRIVSVPYPGVLEDGWGLADAEAEGWTGDRVLQHLKEHLRSADEIRRMSGFPEPETVDEPPPLEAYDDHDMGEHYADDEPHHGGMLQEPFRILGWDRGTGYYLSSECRQIYALTPPQHSKAFMMALAPIYYWRETFPLEKRNQGDGVDWTLAAESLMRRAQKAGIFDPDRVRGRGAWWDQNRAVVHLGDRLVIDGREYGLTEAPTDYVYEEAIPLRLAADHPSSNSDANKLVSICEQVSWEHPISGKLLAGWIFLAPICGALDWRPHIWVTGGAGTGKSTVMKKIIGQTLRRNMLFVVGDTSEAGVRQELGQDAMPVVFDEFESERKKAAERVEDVMALVTQSSSETGAKMLKGGANGRAASYKIRSMFAFSSIAVNLKQHAARTRVTVLSLNKMPETDSSQKRYRQLLHDINDTINNEYVDRLQARAVQMIPQIRANAEVFAEAAAIILKGRRFGDQVGTLLAGAYALHSTGLISREKAEEWIKRQRWDEVEDMDESRDEVSCLTHILTHELRVETSQNGIKTRNVGELVEKLTGRRTDGDIDNDEAEAALKRVGIRVDWQESQHWIGFAQGHKALAKILEGQSWANSWQRTLLRVEGARKHAPKKYAGTNFRGVEIPIKNALGD